MNVNHPATFSVHIIEDEDGNVRVISDWSGKGDRCLSLGIEIMQSLNAVSIFTDGGLSMGQAFSSSTEH
jgi:hypothetical protein